MNPVVVMMMLMVAGYALKLLGYPQLGGRVSRLIFNYLLPVLMFETFASNPLPVEALGVAALVVIYVATSLAALVGVTRLMALEARVRASVVMCSTFQNTAFLAFPVVLSLYGSLLPAAVYTVFSIILFYVVLAAVVALANGDGLSPSRVLGGVARIPAIYGVVLGVAANVSGLAYLVPSVVMEALGLAGMVGVYLSAMVVGLAFPASRRAFVPTLPILVVAGWRMLASPAIHALLASSLVGEGLWYREILVESIMPPATANTVVAYIYGFDTETTTRSTVMLTVTSLAAIYLLRTVGVL